MNLSQLIEGAAQGRWSEERIKAWYDARPWRVGCNFIPSGAINQLEMWQAETFDPKQIDHELGLLAGLAMNTVRVFLHDLLWLQDTKGFLGRIDQFLNIAMRHKISTMLVIFDSCWDGNAQLGPQRAPTPGVHNSYWLKSPTNSIFYGDPAEFDKLEEYVVRVVSHFRNDERIMVWDLWNEPDNRGSERSREENQALVVPMIAKTFQWARSANPSQPLTSGWWVGDLSSDEKLEPLSRLQLAASDVNSFHCYKPLDETRETVACLKRYGRPLLCTEYVARGAGSTFEAILPYFKEEKIAAYNWGAVSGKTQTIYPWDSWQNPYTSEPVPWHHDIFRPDGTPYDAKETELIKALLKK
jgi:hypothetical protein